MHEKHRNFSPAEAWPSQNAQGFPDSQESPPITSQTFQAKMPSEGFVGNSPNQEIEQIYFLIARSGELSRVLSCDFRKSSKGVRRLATAFYRLCRKPPN